MSGLSLGLNEARVAGDEARTCFFNGRLLSAEDLQREQALRESGLRRLGRLIGCGTERGFEVRWSAGGSELGISAGLGISPSGQIIECADLPLDLAVAGSSGRPGGFGECAAAFGQSAALAGLYLLVLTPAWIGEGRAPTLLGEVGACNRKLELAAVRARLVPLKPPAEAAAATLRNRVAAALAMPAAAGGWIGWCPASLAPTLGADDLPVAALQLDLQARIQWADADAVRRRVAPPPGGSADALWPRAGRIAMEAFARQFTAQLRATEAPVAGAFALLPPVLVLDAAGLARWQAVFDGLPNLACQAGPALGRGGFARLLEEGLDARPVSRSGALLQTYRLWRPEEDSGEDLFLLRVHRQGDPDSWSGGGYWASAAGPQGPGVLS